MRFWKDNPAPAGAAPDDDAVLEDNARHTLDEGNLPAVAVANEKRVRRAFWPKLKRYAGRLPFAEDLLAAWYCATDKNAPPRVRTMLFAALAYFILPLDLVPDFILGFGFTDDASVLMLALATIRSNITDTHRAQAKQALAELGAEQTGDPLT
jgi:uncharacterized membrane protein YkvA (DUF1232 family)